MLRPMKDSGVEWIGTIPKSWNTSRLQWALHEIKETNDPIKSENVLSLTIESGVIPYEEKGNQGNKSKEKYEEYKLAYPNTLVVNSMNVIIGAVGISKYFGCVSPVYYVFKNTTNTDLRYIYYLFTNVGFQKEMRKYAKGILEIRLRISSGDMMKLLIPMPSLVEQQRIADFLDAECAKVDSAIEKTKETIEEYKVLKQSIITEAVTKGIRGDRPMKDSGIEWIGEIPASSICPKLKTFARIISKGTTPKDINNELNEHYCIRYLKSENIVNNVLHMSPLFSIDRNTHFGALSRSVLDEADLLFVIAGASIGKTAILTNEFVPANTNQAVAFIRLNNRDGVLGRYIWYSLQSNSMKHYIDLFSVQSAQPNISLENLANFRLMTPGTYEELVEIVRFLDNKCLMIEKLITSKEKQVKELESYKKSLIYEYVTGKKEVKA